MIIIFEYMYYIKVKKLLRKVYDKKNKDTGELLQVNILLWFRLQKFIKMYIEVKTLVKTFIGKN